MNILRIDPIYKYSKFYGKFTNPIPEDSNEFEFFFKPILAKLSGYYWIVEDDSFMWPSEWDHMSSYDSENDKYTDGPMKEALEYLRCIDEDKYSGLLGSPGLIPKYAKYVNIDWNDLFGFQNKIKSPKTWMKNYWQTTAKNRHSYIAKTTDIWFSNIDGAYWTIWARNANAHRQVRCHAQTLLCPYQRH